MSVKSGARIVWNDPLKMPKAGGYLWNHQMLLQLTCRGFANALHLQPEPAKYSHAPNLEAKTFIQPEAPVYAHHPGRFVYIKDLTDHSIFSVPYEPTRVELDDFEFSIEPHQLGWRVRRGALRVEFSVTLAATRPLELWTLTVSNSGNSSRSVQVYPYFPVGYMSWMNQSARYEPELQAIICRSITPYQKLEDYYRQKEFRDLTAFLADRTPDAWDSRQEAFEGEGGLVRPSAVAAPSLCNSDAIYETPTAAMQFGLNLPSGEHQTLRFAFGPVLDVAEVVEIKKQCFAASPEQNVSSYQKAHQSLNGCLSVQTPDRSFDDFVNHWLVRQIRYHADTQRMTTDPQTRNYLQDAMGLCYVEPAQAKAAIIKVLEQQAPDSSLPDGVLLNANAELKYINQVPHTDHTVWLPIAIQTYLAESGDYDLLDQAVEASDGSSESVLSRTNRALLHLLANRDQRGLSLIGQGDWCDPMNMVGHKGHGVSTWLTLATAFAVNIWSDLCDRAGKPTDAFSGVADACNQAVNKYLWDTDWYARGITDEGRRFGVAEECEGKIYLNPQSWALLSGAADSRDAKCLVEVVKQHLGTPYGLQMLGPAYTQMQQDIGRISQKFPGVAENGSVYNHASLFFVFALYRQGGFADYAYELLGQMIPGPAEQDCLQREQLPVFLPNYYRGDWRGSPRTAGRSSQLINTGSVHWYYRCLVEGLFGIVGDGVGLSIRPQLPSHWQQARCCRRFRGANFEIDIRRDKRCEQTQVVFQGEVMSEPRIEQFSPGQTYQVRVTVPADDN